MNGISVFVLLLLAAVVKSDFDISKFKEFEHMTEEQREKAIKVFNDCMAETGVTNEMMEKSVEGDFPDDIVFKHHLVCIGKKTGFIDENGKHIKEKLKEKLMIIFNNEEKVDSVLSKCFMEKGTPEETAFELAKCCRQEFHN
uniref:Odorant binding protein 1 n=1 Tax=Tomicus yunnanensis TaxID=768153 RepID=A0A4P2HSL7_9CUCU|nr:odorant binding protein 1 [Tomicus yunnanensis]